MQGLAQREITVNTEEIMYLIEICGPYEIVENKGQIGYINKMFHVNFPDCTTAINSVVTSLNKYSDRFGGYVIIWEQINDSENYKNIYEKGYSYGRI